MVEDVRHAIIQQGALYIPGANAANIFRPVITAAQQVQRERINTDITEKYNERRVDATIRMNAEYERIDREIDKEKRLATEHITDPNEIKSIEENWEEKREKEYQRVGAAFDKENETIDREENEERQQTNDNLTRVIEELTEEIRKSGSLNPNSYLSRLREQRRQAILERDTAEDEETTRAAGQRVRELDLQIRNVERGETTSMRKASSSDNNETNFRLAGIQTIMGANQMFSGAQHMNLGSVIAGVGQSLDGITSMFGPYGAVAGAGISTLSSVLGGIASLVQNQAQKSDQMAGLAALVRNDRTIGNGTTIADTRQHMFSDLYDYSPMKGGASIYDLGMSTPEFAQSASRRIRQRGIASDGITEAYFQEALERVFSLDTGSLGQAGRYDRYGINATDGITMLVERLSRIQNSGVSQGNYVRVQEYLNMQQDLMKQYTNFTPTPSVGLANRELEAVASMRGYTVNENTANDLRTARSAITNPQNDRMRALLYGTVEELMPETAGRADLIKRAINDPNKQGAIMRAYFQKVENMYGGTDTPMGYYAFESILPQMTDKQRDAFI